jgi:hypothetical protein
MAWQGLLFAARRAEERLLLGPLGKAYVWVCPEGMECFSRFVLVCQKIARIDINTVWKPQITTKTVMERTTIPEFKP